LSTEYQSLGHAGHFASVHPSVHPLVSTLTLNQVTFDPDLLCVYVT